MSFLLILGTRRCRRRNYFYFQRKLLFDLAFLVSAGGDVTSGLQDCSIYQAHALFIRALLHKAENNEVFCGSSKRAFDPPL